MYKDDKSNGKFNEINCIEFADFFMIVNNNTAFLLNPERFCYIC